MTQSHEGWNLFHSWASGADVLCQAVGAAQLSSQFYGFEDDLSRILPT